MIFRELFESKNEDENCGKKQFRTQERDMDLNLSEEQNLFSHKDLDPEMFLSGSTQAYGRRQLDIKSIAVLERLILKNKGHPIALSCGK